VRSAVQIRHPRPDFGIINLKIMAIEYSHGRTTASAKVKVTLSLVVGIAVFILTGSFVSWKVAPLLGWDAAALVYGFWVWSSIWKLDGNLTSKHALREDPSRAVSDIVVLGGSVASLAAVGVVLGGSQSNNKVWYAALGVASVVLSWLVVHTIFALRYAELFYHGSRGGVDFTGTDKPAYTDFAYLAYTVGMTFQVSDTGFSTSEFRKLALRHALISYMFGTVIVATTINLVAGLSK
jgi:uncharacterized membrane protein